MNLDMFMETEQGKSMAHGHTEEPAWAQSRGRPWACTSGCVLIFNLLVHCCLFRSDREIVRQEWLQHFMMPKRNLKIFLSNLFYLIVFYLKSDSTYPSYIQVDSGYGKENGIIQLINHAKML